MVKQVSSTMQLGNMKGVALITGAASGIGKETARAFAAVGARLVLLDRDYDGLVKLKAELGLKDGDILIEKIDVRDLPGIAKFIRSIPEKMGGLHFCFNIAGILGPDYNTALDQLPDEHWDLVMDINLRAPILITKECVRLMLKNEPLPSELESAGLRLPGVCSRRGVIINLGSSASLRARSHAGAPYITSKHALVGLTKVTAVSYGKDGIRCNILAPGFVDTPLVAGLKSKVKEITETVVPMKRPAYPQEIADLIVFLCSERANYLNGITIPVDGGWSAM